MKEREARDFDVDALLNGLFAPEPIPRDPTLKELFEQRIKDLDISTTSALEILKMQSRALNGILKGTQKVIDFTCLIKLAHFLQAPQDRIVRLYMAELEKNFPIDSSSDKVEFIKNNFDLAVLQKAGFIKSISDFEDIEARIVGYLGLRSIFDYKRPPTDVAFSAGLIEPKNSLSRSFWIDAATNVFLQVNNPNAYDRQQLIEYFPEIRWHSTNVELGLINVIKSLYAIGVTVIYQPSLPSLHLRGATFAVRDKPCIVITDYAGFYPTLWFALVHELFHVLFDWEDIRNNSYHLSDQDTETLSIKEKEKEADNFAREYLFSKEKTLMAKPLLYSPYAVREFAQNNHVHPSFVYVFYAFDNGKTDKMAWARAKKESPNFAGLIEPFENPWESAKPITEFVKSIKTQIYN